MNWPDIGLNITSNQHNIDVVTGNLFKKLNHNPSSRTVLTDYISRQEMEGKNVEYINNWYNIDSAHGYGGYLKVARVLLANWEICAENKYAYPLLHISM